MLPLLEQEAAIVGAPSPPVLSPTRHVYNVNSFPPPQPQERYHPDMVVGKALLPAIFHVNITNLEGCYLHMNDYFTVTGVLYTLI